MRFSIVVVTYNPDKYKLRLTLKSILEQSYKDYEIVVSDDGSEENHFEYIEQIFDEYNFNDYVLVPHKKNQGTVKNLISAMEYAKGEYIRDFGPGDMFYSKDTLYQMYRFLERQSCDFCFGLIQGYQIKNKELLKSNFCHPFDIQAYRKKDTNDRKIRNLILYGDNLSGAAICVRRNVYKNYLIKICEYVAVRASTMVDKRDSFLVDPFLFGSNGATIV